MSISNIINKFSENLSSLNAQIKQYHSTDKLTPFRYLQNNSANQTNEANVLENAKGSRVYTIDIDSPPVDAGGMGINRVLYRATILLRVRYDWQGSPRTYAISSEDSSWITTIMLNPNNRTAQTESIVPPTTTYERPTSDTLIVNFSFDVIYYEDALSNLPN